MAKLEQSPSRWQFFNLHEAWRREVEALTTYSLLRLGAERLATIRQKVRPRDLAFHKYRMISPLPSKSVRHLAADASLFRQHHSATIRSQPPHRPFDHLC